MTIRVLLTTASVAATVLAAAGAHATGPSAAVYDTGAGLGANQTWGGTLGLDFTVNSNVKITQLGAFDATGGAIASDIRTTIFNTAGVAVTPTADFRGATAAAGSSYAFQPIAPVTLAPGRYQVASWGYNATDGNYNTYGANPGPITFATLGGALSAGQSFYSDPSGAGSLATIADVGSTRYGAGSFFAVGAPGPYAPPPAAIHGIYDTAAGLAGNQTWGGTLGLNFTVNSAVRVTSLATFDAGGDGISGDLKAVIFNAAGVAVTPTLDFSGAANPSGGAYVFKSLGGPVTLGPGSYQLATWGYSAADPNYNTYGANPGPITFNALGGRLTAVSTSYSNPSGAGSFATIPDVGATRYGGGSFLAVGVPEPATWALMLTGFGAIGGAVRARRRVFAVSPI